MKVGLITYHSAYNFGSVLQAYATQETIKNIAKECEIIDYRSKEQQRVYAIFKWDKGSAFLKSIIKNILSLFFYGLKKKRQKKYENTMNLLFNLSERCETPEEVYNIWGKYETIVSGSDQIWNKHSNELENVSWEYMNPYLLRGFEGKKVSYASSVTNMSDDELGQIYPDIKKFNCVSIRERESCERLNVMYQLNAINVLDPTFLLKRGEWITKLKLQDKNFGEYILFYALGKRSEIKEMLEKVKKIAMVKKLKVKVVTPLNYIKPQKEIEILWDVDPVEFLTLIYNAKEIITDSYHGTILSINLEKEIYSICKGHPSDFRKIDILERIGLKDRVVANLEELLEKEYNKIDYLFVGKLVDEMREESIVYLKNALGDESNEYN